MGCIITVPKSIVVNVSEPMIQPVKIITVVKSDHIEINTNNSGSLALASQDIQLKGPIEEKVDEKEIVENYFNSLQKKSVFNIVNFLSYKELAEVRNVNRLYSN